MQHQWTYSIDQVNNSQLQDVKTVKHKSSRRSKIETTREIKSLYWKREAKKVIIMWIEGWPNNEREIEKCEDDEESLGSWAK